jgi:RNA polymerase sigma-70 factor (ECF subfamily)
LIVLCREDNLGHSGAGNDAIETLYRQHSPALLIFALALTGERGRAQDAVHQVFLKLLERGLQRHIIDAKAYLFACVRNAILNDIKVRERNVPLEQQAAWFDPPNRDYGEELNLRRALWTLREDQRAVTTLHVWGELTFAQIGEILGINSNTAASRYRSALEKLREAMCIKEDPCAEP